MRGCTVPEILSVYSLLSTENHSVFFLGHSQVFNIARDACGPGIRSHMQNFTIRRVKIQRGPAKGRCLSEHCLDC